MIEGFLLSVIGAVGFNLLILTPIWIYAALTLRKEKQFREQADYALMFNVVALLVFWGTIAFIYLRPIETLAESFALGSMALMGGGFLAMIGAGVSGSLVNKSRRRRDCDISQR